MTGAIARPAAIIAWQFNGEARRDWPDWLKRRARATFALGPGSAVALIHIRCRFGTMLAQVGDWIIKDKAGEITACGPKFFAENFEVEAEL